MVVTNEDRYAVLERKLMEAESALFGCRAVLNQIRKAEGHSGLLPGQISPPELREEHIEEECVE